MIRHFCDVCSREIINGDKGSIFIKGPRAYSKFRVDYSQDEVCPLCINSVMTQLEKIRKENEK